MAEWTSPETWKQEMISKEIEWEQELAKRESARLREKGIEWLGGPVPFDEYTFDKFDPELNGTARIKKVVQEFDIFRGNLFLLGPVGTGKTHLMTAKAHRVLELGGTVRVFSAFTFKVLLEYDGWLSVLKGLSFVGLDDIDECGSGKRTQTAIKLMIQERNNFKKFGMFITSNKPLATLGKIFGGKVQDRIDGHFQNLVIPPETKSARGLLKAAEKKRSEK